MAYLILFYFILFKLVISDWNVTRTTGPKNFRLASESNSAWIASFHFVKSFFLDYLKLSVVLDPHCQLEHPLLHYMQKPRQY